MKKLDPQSKGPQPHQRVIWVFNAACPSQCVYCDIASQRSGRGLDASLVEEIAKQIVGLGFREIIFVGGEPLLSPHLSVALSALGGGLSVALFSGGLPKPPPSLGETLSLGVTRMVYSLDSGVTALNDKIRGLSGITAALVKMADSIHEEHPALESSINSVVSRHNHEHLDSVWERLSFTQPNSWSLTLAGDNFGATISDPLLGDEELQVYYLETIPRLARRLQRDGAELVVLPVPLSLLRAGLPMQGWDGLEAGLRRQVCQELSSFARGEFNLEFVRAYGCPLIGTDISLGVEGEVYPCSQAPILQPKYVLGSLRSESLRSILSADRLRAFQGAMPHPPCARCWAPSNIEGQALRSLLAEPPR